MAKRIFLLAQCLFFLMACEPKSSRPITENKSEKLFSEDSILPISLQINLQETLSDIKEDRKYHEGFLIWKGKKIKIAVRTRGKIRRDPEVCDFPPFTIRFDSASALGTPFEGQNKLKLITHCQKNDPLYEQLLIEEYGIYKTYQLLTDKSFEVRLLNIRYQDLADSSISVEKKAVFIQNIKELAAQMGAKVLEEKDTVRYRECNSFLMTQAAVFAFMVGHTDWSVSNRHNVEILQTASNPPIPILYDFDLLGLIDPPYGAPDPELKIENLTDRLYRGYCGSEAELKMVLEKFRNKQQSIDSLWAVLPYHDPLRKQKARKYLADFFQIIHNQDSIQHYFFKNCR
jgi:hypothetical protein